MTSLAAPHDAAPVPTQEAGPAPAASPPASRAALPERLYGLATAGAAWLVLLILIAVTLSMALGGKLAFQTFGLGFVTSANWDVVNGQFGAFVPIYGTLVTSAIALVIAVPVSIGIALFLTDIAPVWSRQPIAVAIELLAAVPSIIYGMWGLFLFAPFMASHVEPWVNDTLGSLPLVGPLFAGPPIGIGMLTAGIVLGIMIVPFIASVARDVLNAVPAALRESAVALGATRWEILRHVSLPYTRSAIVGAIFLGLGRALGETMAVTFVLGNAHDLSASLLMPSNSIAAAIANEFTEADTELYRSSLIALAFLLFIVTFIVLSLAKLMLARMDRSLGRTH
ncbi:phosphate ABC transporter permease subunit PstC [Novosphingobium profundi]|uniref:phosphate ABC transporter permease subunit PstC n=1 Tax=Novosphingobium profundi TaxID=1774954 RepID=UPI001FE76393|nr:phosphate ABC transporter permease subunit PstC [Novosphingobium profundi]MBT0670178.1 phosphate ABC transporter permease subunit PstC [Novosphingobium profundi]